MTTQKPRADREGARRVDAGASVSPPRPPVGRRRAGARIPRLAYSPEEAAEALGVSRDYLDEHVMPDLRVVRKGRRRLVPLPELERWLAENAHRAGE